MFVVYVPLCDHFIKTFLDLKMANGQEKEVQKKDIHILSFLN